MKKDEKVTSKCEVCHKRIRIYSGAEKLCRKHYDEAHADDYSRLSDFIINGGKEHVV